jgi:hypothetical protein
VREKGELEPAGKITGFPLFSVIFSKIKTLDINAMAVIDLLKMP